MANSSDAALVARVRVYADLLESAEVFIGIDSLNGSGAAIDLRALLTAYATVQAERDAAVSGNFPLTWGEITRRSMETKELRAALATLRETLVGEVRAMRMEHTHPCNEYHRRATDPHPPYDYERECVCNADVTNAALDRAINLIKGTP